MSYIYIQKIILNSKMLKPRAHIIDAKFHSFSDITPCLFINMAMSVWSVFTLCSLISHRKRKFYSSPFHSRVFSFMKNEKPLAVGSGSTDLILPLSLLSGSPLTEVK